MSKLTDEQIEDLYFDEFSISKLKEFARAIESAATEPLLQRIAELERQLDAMRAQIGQGVPEVSTEHGPWVPSTIHDGETYCKRCLTRSVFAGNRACDPHIVYTHPAQQQKPLTDEHVTDGSKCWCAPELNYKDPDTGVEVWVHRSKQ